MEKSDVWRVAGETQQSPHRLSELPQLRDEKLVLRTSYLRWIQKSCVLRNNVSNVGAHRTHSEFCSALLQPTLNSSGRLSLGQVKRPRHAAIRHVSRMSASCPHAQPTALRFPSSWALTAPQHMLTSSCHCHFIKVVSSMSSFTSCDIWYLPGVRLDALSRSSL